MDPKQMILEVWDDMTEGEVRPDDSDVDAMIGKYGPDAIMKMCEGLRECDEGAEAMWSEVRWELIP